MNDLELQQLQQLLLLGRTEGAAALVRDLGDARKEIEALRARLADLLRYVRHGDDCNGFEGEKPLGPMPGKCHCGLDRLLPRHLRMQP